VEVIWETVKSRSFDRLFVSATLGRGRHRLGVVDTTLQTHSPAGSTWPLRSPLTASSLQISLQSCEHISRTARAISARLSARVSHGRGSVLLWRRRDMPGRCGLMDDAMFAQQSGIGDNAVGWSMGQTDGQTDDRPLHRLHTDDRLTALCPGLPGLHRKKHSPTHTHRDHQTSFINFLHLLQSIASSLSNLRAWQSFSTTSLQVLFDSALGLGASTWYSTLASPSHLAAPVIRHPYDWHTAH